MVQIHPDPPLIASGGFTGPSEFIDSSPNGAIAQLGERLPCTQEVSGSIPLSSTTYCLDLENASDIEVIAKRRSDYVL